MTTTSITSGQLKQITRFTEDATAKGLEAALTKVSPDQEGMQRVIENGDEYTARIENAIETALRELSVSNQYANEEVSSNYGYPDGYRVKGVNEQGNILRQLFPGIGMNDERLVQQPLPAGAEGNFVFPRWEEVAPTYGQALEIALELLKKQRKGKFKNWREGQLDAKYLRLTERTARKLKALGDSQSTYDLLVVPAQFGLRHRGRSVRRAREVFVASEFGLGPFEGVCMLLTHPERFATGSELWIDFSGAEYSPDAGGRFEYCPYAYFHDGHVNFDTLWFVNSHVSYGSVSAFLPQ